MSELEGIRLADKNCVDLHEVCSERGQNDESIDEVMVALARKVCSKYENLISQLVVTPKNGRYAGSEGSSSGLEPMTRGIRLDENEGCCGPRNGKSRCC